MQLISTFLWFTIISSTVIHSIMLSIDRDLLNTWVQLMILCTHIATPPPFAFSLQTLNTLYMGMLQGSSVVGSFQVSEMVITSNISSKLLM